VSDFYFEHDESFGPKAVHVRSSLNPLGDMVREKTDEIGKRARALAEQEAARWKAQRDTTRGLLKNDFQREKLRYFRARAMAMSLDLYVKTLRFTMESGEEVFGTVTAMHGAGDLIEFGGTDRRFKLGNTGQYLDYPAFAFLRRALNGG
jgi:hypothetical protein